MSMTLTVIRSNGRKEFYEAVNGCESEKVGDEYFITMEGSQEVRLLKGDKAYLMNSLGNTVHRIGDAVERDFVTNPSSGAL